MKKILTLLLITIGLTGFSQKVTNTWDGSWNAYWHNGSNWSLNHIPTSTEDVVIPNGMPRYPFVGSSDEEIKSLTIYSNAYVKIGAYQLSVSGNVDVYGEIDMDNSAAELSCNNITWKSGSEVQTTGACVFYVSTKWEFDPGADVQMDNGTVYFLGSGSSYIISQDVDCYFNNIWVNKTGATFSHNSASTTVCKIKGYLYLYGSNYDFFSWDTNTIQIGGNFYNGDASIGIYLANGAIEFTGNLSSVYFRPRPGDYFNNLIVNTGSFDLDLSTTNATSLEIKGDVTINSGRLDVNSMDLIVGGDWNNNVGASGFVERDEKVTFNGSGHQYCSDESFYTLEIDKSSGALRTSGTDVECDEYDWIAGAVDVLSGSFTANDLLDNAIQGSFYVNAGGIINLHNDGGYIDLKGDLYIYGGEFNVYGGSLASYWPYQEDASITMSDGVLDFKEQGIKIDDNVYALTDNITGGRIMCAGYLFNERADFTPNAGIFEMYGPTDANIKTINGGRFWNLAINKTTDKDGHEVKPFTDRDGTFYDGSRGNSAVALSNIENYSHLYIDGGTFDLGTFDFTTNGSAVIYGNLKMTSSSNDFSVGWDMQWASGSTANVTAGNFHVYRHWYFYNGSNAQIGPGNTLRFKGSDLQFFYCNDADAEYGSVIIENTISSAWLHSTSTQQMHVTGNMTVNNGAQFYIQNEDLLVNGILDIKNGGYMSLYVNGLLTNNSNFNLNGELNLGEGDVLIHGTFDIASTGELTIDGGSFGYDTGVQYCDIYGALNLSDGLFFVDETIRIQASADINVSGGTIRGGSIIALTASTFQPSDGVYECQTTTGTSGAYSLHSTNYFHDLKINPTAGGGGIAYADVHVSNDLTIDAGHLSFGEFTVTVDNDVTIYGGLSMDESGDELIVGNDIFWKPGSFITVDTDGEIHVNGNWTFENGTNAQLGVGNVVRFIGSGSTSIYNYDADASFGSIALNKDAGKNTYCNGLSTYPIHCTGGLSVGLSNNMHIQHEVLIVDLGIFINNNALLDMLSNGSLESGGYVDLYGTLDVDGGEATVNGNFTLYSIGTLSITDGSFICDHVYNGAYKEIRGTLNFTGDGLFEITNNSVQIYSTANCNITDGIFRVGGNFVATQAGTFLPTGGIVDMSDGHLGGTINCTNGNSFYDLEINTYVSAGSDLLVEHDLNINSGKFSVEDQTVEIGHFVNIYGSLQMTQSAGVLESLWWIYWRPGSVDDVSAGNIYTKYWAFEDGTNAQLGTGNTAHVISGIDNLDADAEFGNLIIGDWNKSLANKENLISSQTNNENLFADGSTYGVDSDGSTQENQMDGKAYYPRRVEGYCTYLPGANWSSSVDIIVQGTLDIMDGASQTINSTNTISTYSDFTLNGTLNLGSLGNGYVDGNFEIASTGELIIGGGEFIVENHTDSYTDNYGTLTMTDGLLQVRNNLVMKSTATTNVSEGMLRAGGFRADTPGTFEPIGGVVEIQTLNGGSGPIDCTNGNYLYDLNINREGSSGGAYLDANLLVINDLDILLGGLWFKGFIATVQGNTTIYDGYLRMEETSDVLNAGNDPTDEIIWKSDASLYSNNKGRINIFGDCTIEDGVMYNIEADQTFSFVGTGDQNLYNYDDATFGTIDLDKPSGALIIPASSTVICQSYDWTSGTLSVNGGSFTAYDLFDANGLFGTYNLYDGVIHLIQGDGQLPDLNANVTIVDGTFTIEGGVRWCWWGWAANTSVTMSGGEFNFIDNGVKIDERLSYTLTENITGGVIRTNGDFISARPEFTPLGGTVELYGSTLASISTEEGHLHNFVLDKVETDNMVNPHRAKKGEITGPADFTRVNLNEDLLVNGITTIESGQLVTMGFDMSCYDDVEINDGGTLTVTELSQISLDNFNALNVNSGGILDAEGMFGNEVVFTRNTGYYNLNVQSGGTISAEHTIFEYMAAGGVNVMSGAVIDPSNPFDYCTFRYGKAGSTLFHINNNQTLTIDGAEFYTGGSENYNVAKTVNSGNITFTNFGGDFAGPAHEKDQYGRIHWFVPELSVSPSVRNVGAAAGTTTFGITSNTNWTVSESTAWFTVSPGSGNYNGMLTVTYDENLLLTPRSGIITISGDDVPDVVVTVNQAGAAPELTVLPANRDVSSAAGTTTFGVSSNTSWTVVEGMDWLSVSPIGGSGNGTLTVNYDENLTILSRIGTITISAAGVPNVNVTVTQAGADPELAVNPANRNVPYLAGSTNFNVVSNTSWTVSKNVAWLTLVTTGGSNNGTLTVNFHSNWSASPRVGEITVSATGVPDVVVTITQAGADPALAVAPTNRDVSSAAGTTSFGVTSNTSWTISEGVGWLTVTPMSGNNNGTLTVNYSENTSVSGRVGEITVSADGVSDVVVTVSQAGAAPELAVLPANRDVSAAAGSTSFDVSSNTSWTVSESVYWLMVAPMSGDHNETLTVNYTENTSTSGRVGSITVSASGVPDVEVTVSQAGADPELAVTPANRNVPYLAGSTSFDVISNTAWTVSKNVAWLTLGSTVGNGNGPINVGFHPNNSTTPRVGEITVSADGVPDVVVTVSQGAADPELAVDPANRDVSFEAGTTTFTIISNTDWTISESVGWFTVNPMSGNNFNTVTVNYNENSSTSGRVGSITVSAAGVPDVIVTVSQAGTDPVLTVLPDNRMVNPPAGSTTFNISSNTGWTVSETVPWLSVDPGSGSGNGLLTVNYDQNSTGIVRSGSITITATGGAPEQTVTVIQESYNVHTINISEGWSGLSSYITPADNDIENVFGSVVDKLTIAQTMDEYYYPFYGVNTIGTWDQHAAFRVKFDMPAELLIIGTFEMNQTVMLDAEWELLPVVQQSPKNVEDLFSPVVGDLVIVKEIAGPGIYWPGMGINSLLSLNPGEAYYVLMSATSSVTFMPPAMNTPIGQKVEYIPNPEWNIMNQTPTTHVIAIENNAQDDFEQGDYIGAFTQQGLCSGQVMIDKNLEQTAIVIFGNDPYASTNQGFAEGEIINFRYFKTSTEEEFELLPEFNLMMPNANGLFEENGLSAIIGFKVGSTGINGFVDKDIHIYPNPSNSVFNVSGVLPGAKIEVTDVHGQSVFIYNALIDDVFRIDLDGKKAGIYLMTIKQKNITTYHKLILR